MTHPPRRAAHRDPARELRDRRLREPLPGLRGARRGGRGGGLHRRPRPLARQPAARARAEALMWVWRQRYEELGAREDDRLRVRLRKPRRRGRRHAAPPARADLRLPVPAAGAGARAGRRRASRRLCAVPAHRARARRRHGDCSTRTRPSSPTCPRRPAGRMKCTSACASTAAACRTASPTSCGCWPRPCSARARLRRAVRAPVPVRDGRAPGADRRRRALGGHLHVEFYPPLRTAEKLKYLAGSEQGAGTFISDVLPEEAAAALREAIERGR